MNSLIHADIFFFVTTIFIVIISIAVIIITVYLTGILSDIRYMAKEWRKENEFFIKDARNFRDAVRDEGVKWKQIADAIYVFVGRFITPKKTTKKLDKK